MNNGFNLLALQDLETRLGYAFQNIELLEQALTHRSFGPLHNERLEYLGDAILGMIIAKRLYDLFPKSPEGDLTRMRSTLVRETMLAEIAREYGVNLTKGYNGNLSSKDAGTVGGQMVRKMVEDYQRQHANQ